MTFFIATVGVIGFAFFVLTMLQAKNVAASPEVRAAEDDEQARALRRKTSSTSGDPDPIATLH